MFSKKSSIGVILMFCFTLLLSACSSEPSKTKTASEGTEKPAAELKITPFNPGENGLFSVTSSLIEGPSEVLLVDAQFEKNNAEQLVKMIRETGKKLTTVYVSHKDPDFYFGLSAIREAFPDVKIVATPATVEGIKATIKIKSEFWGPIMKENAPTALIVPDVLEGDKLTVDGQTVQVIGLDGSDPSHTVLWVPSKKTILGGVPIYENLHVWMADNQTPESRDHWREILDRILALKPERVIPGHYMGKSSEDKSTVSFTRDYIVEFEAAAKQAKNSTELIAAMKKAHPELKNTSDLELSAQVIKGERSWP
ncbi:MBL fold metallo-hydrolase [Brevibacillus laterosporus]|uniref:MBL fold metallo-hydrolase n=1 Tax=Brevibacillus laterosporus TaxID=1465 RepID=UPI0026537600|nr:MBL fold metallo-hydrolase [Brevibacillus laterosporus]MDN9008975.1 MBL fold metallo-hydrolase [Brevibacillus laterosporus]MDO0941082.1 MBL fold metallo-hydrolase [Brevibacillus laterosporus]